MDLENIMLSEKGYTQKITYSTILFIQNVQNRQIQKKIESSLVIAYCWEVGENEGLWFSWGWGVDNEIILKLIVGTSLAVQWLRLCTSNAGGAGSIPSQGTKIPHAVQCDQKQIKWNETKWNETKWNKIK